MNNKIICLLGPSAVGKDTINKKLCEILQFISVVSTTTRPIRTAELEGTSYFFKTKEEFIKLIKSNKLIEYRTYDTLVNNIPDVWYYGIEKENINLNNFSYCSVIETEGLKSLIKFFGKENIIAFLIMAEPKIREERAKKRDLNFDQIEWDRRLITDKEKFEKIKSEVDFIIMNNVDNDLNPILDIISCLVELKGGFYNE